MGITADKARKITTQAKKLKILLSSDNETIIEFKIKLCEYYEMYELAEAFLHHKNRLYGYNDSYNEEEN